MFSRDFVFCSASLLPFRSRNERQSRIIFVRRAILHPIKRAAESSLFLSLKRKFS